MEFCSNPECPGHQSKVRMCDFDAEKPNETEVVSPGYTLVAKLALLMPGYMNDLNEDENSPCLIETDGKSEAIVKLTKEENDILVVAMQYAGIGDEHVIKRSV
jgi:hypothetical protein